MEIVSLAVMSYLMKDASVYGMVLVPHFFLDIFLMTQIQR